MTRVEQIQALRAKGKTEKQIADELGIKPNSVSSMEAKARARPKKFTVSGNVYFDIIRAATLRGKTADELCDEILSAILCDNLIPAILDE